MPSSTQGLTGNEIVTRVRNWVGNKSADFQSYLEETLPLAEHRFCSLHPWKFLRQNNLALTVASGTGEYELSAANIGYYMSVSDVESIYNASEGIYLKKTDLDTIRRYDTKNDDGSATSNITHWAPVGDNKILVYPTTFEDTELRIDGYVRPVSLYTLTNYPTIPPHYQESFIQYIIALSLDRENDDRAQAKMQEAMGLIRQDIQNDLDADSDNQDLRIKHYREHDYDGRSGNVEQAFLNHLFSW